MFPEQGPAPTGVGTSPQISVVATGNQIFAIAADGAWLIHPREGKTLDLPLPVAPRPGAALAATEQEIYLFGGGPDRNGVHDVLVYNKQRGVWDRAEPCPAPLLGASATFHEGFLYVTGGQSQGRGSSDEHRAFDPIERRWMNWQKCRSDAQTSRSLRRPKVSLRREACVVAGCAPWRWIL